MPLWNRAKLDVTSSHDYARAYIRRPLVPPAAIAPLISNALDLAFIFSSFGPQVMFAKNDLSQAAAEFDKEYAQLMEACRALTAVRIADEFPPLIGVHMTIEGFLAWLTQSYQQDALLLIALSKEDKREVKRLHELKSKHEEALEKAKINVQRAIHELRNEAPDQYATLNFSSNNLIDLGLEDLAEE